MSVATSSRGSESKAYGPQRLFGTRRSGVAQTRLLGGDDVAAQFLAADLLDGLILGIAPGLVGSGPSLADGRLPLRRFALKDVQSDHAALALLYMRAR